MLRHILTLLLLTSILACNKPKPDVTFTKKINELKDLIIGKNLSKIQEIIGDSIVNLEKHKLIFLIADGDCGICIEKGFEIYNKIKKLNKYECSVISAGANIGHIQVAFNYTDYIYSDKDDHLRKTLRYSYTPILLVLDNKNTVKYSLITNSKAITKTKVKNFMNHFE